jgi:hypothetical protein
LNHHKRRAGAILTAACTLILLGAGSAAAAPAPGPARADDWQMTPCVIPEFDEVNIDPGVHMLVLTGAAVQCPPVVRGGGFRIAAYHPDASEGVAEGYNIRLFDTFGPGILPVRRFGAAILPVEPGEYGACVLAGADERAGCVLVTVTPEDEDEVKADLSPLPVDDPLVDRKVLTGPYTGDVGPPGDLGGSCGTCF